MFTSSLPIAAFLSCATEPLEAPPGEDDGVVWAGEEDACPPGFPEDAKGLCIFDEDAVSDIITSFEDGGFERVTPETYTMQTEPWWPHNVWISDGAVVHGDGTETSLADLYASIDPDDPEFVLDSPLPAGTIILHVADGPPFRGVFVKRQAEYLPEENDWWLGNFMDDGTPVDRTACNPITCMECHTMDDRADRTDLLWGVPRDAL